MERSWSDAARATLDAYPWPAPGEKARAAREAELVSFGARVEVDDLPLAVRRWAARGARAGAEWRGESWDELHDAFDRSVLEQVLRRTDGNTAAAARLLKTTARVVAYTARRVGLRTDDFKTKQANRKR